MEKLQQVYLPASARTAYLLQYPHLRPDQVDIWSAKAITTMAHRTVEATRSCGCSGGIPSLDALRVFGAMILAFD